MTNNKSYILIKQFFLFETGKLGDGIDEYCGGRSIAYMIMIQMILKPKAFAVEILDMKSHLDIRSDIVKLL